jgi:multiple sugar transport system permease protein
VIPTPTTNPVVADQAGTADQPPPRGRRERSLVRVIALAAGAFVFLFPFYYMLIGSLQEEPDTSVSGAFPNPSNLTTKNYSDINSSINLLRSLVNSGIFTAAVVLSTLFFGLLAGYSLAVLHYRGRGVAFASVLVVLTIPFQLLMIPLYVLLVRDYGLGDTYLGMILPFAINATAVFIFRQFFLQLPVELFEAARIDGAGEFDVLRRIAIPLALPVILTVTLVTFIGPWNEFLWPFLVTKDAAKQPLAVALANYISNVSSRASNPFGSILAGACVLAAPVIALFVVFQRHFRASDIGSGVKG